MKLRRITQQRRSKRRKQIPYKSYKDARAYARSLNLKCRREWFNAMKQSRPIDIPCDAMTLYKNNGWLGWQDFLGTETIRAGDQIYMPFKWARTIARSLNARTKTEWVKQCKSKEWLDKWRATEVEPGIPVDPRNSYIKNGWLGWKDWLKRK